MGLAHIEELMNQFILHGADPDLPAAVIDNGTRINQHVVTGTLRTLGALAREANLRGPTIIIVGTVVTLRDKLVWYAPTPGAAAVFDHDAAASHQCANQAIGITHHLDPVQ
jgi:uroporphyrin-III C-methyltransferase/precorrin-2 dehydrogenase/sirohydrochlorin ferrochelatase